MSKWTNEQKQEIKQLVIETIVKRLTAVESQQYISQKLKIQISLDYLNHLKASLKTDMKKDLLSLQKDKYLFVESTFVDRKHELEALQKMLHNIVANNADKPDVQVNAIARLHEISVSLGGLYDILPIIGGVNPRSLVIEEEVEKGKIPEDYDPRTDLNRLF
jgi:hypothetical protein